MFESIRDRYYKLTYGLRVKLYRAKEKRRRARLTPEQRADEDRRATELQEALAPLVRALEAGNYDARPTKLKNGCELKVEDLSGVMESVTFDATMRDPKWWEFWKRWSKDYMYLLRYQQRQTRISFKKNLRGERN